MNKPHAQIYSAEINKWIAGTLKLPTYLWPEPARGKIKTEKTTARYSCLLRHSAWKWTGPILISALQKFVTYLLT